jgi:hypothetical protein
VEQHKLAIDMNETTIDQLRDHHFALFGLHAIATSASGAPTIWLSVHYLERHLEVAWNETFSMFTTRRTPHAPSTKVVAAHNYPAPLGSVLTVAGNDGAGIVTPGGRPGTWRSTTPAGSSSAPGSASTTRTGCTSRPASST